ncbi:MAG TPA: VOC family protein [Humibacter sp.]|nr:VOC family protein [Humibacter sp.]
MTIQTDTTQATAGTSGSTTAAKIEVVVIPVADADRAKAFYETLGWHLDVDLVIADDYRVIEFTPTGSPTSVILGVGVSDAQPGSTKGIMLVVDDIEAARADLVARGVDASEIFHDATGVFHHAGTTARLPGLAPERASYSSFLSFDDPDGNQWVVQEVTARIPGRNVRTSFDSPAEVSAALRRAAVAHGEHEKRTGHEDENWPDWYAEYIVREAAGQQRPE